MVPGQLTDQLGVFVLHRSPPTHTQGVFIREQLKIGRKLLAQDVSAQPRRRWHWTQKAKWQNGWGSDKSFHCVLISESAHLNSAAIYHWESAVFFVRVVTAHQGESCIQQRTSPKVSRPHLCQTGTEAARVTFSSNCFWHDVWGHNKMQVARVPITISNSNVWDIHEISEFCFRVSPLTHFNIKSASYRNPNSFSWLLLSVLTRRITSFYLQLWVKWAFHDRTEIQHGE